MGILKEISDVLRDAKNVAKEVNVVRNDFRSTSLAKISSQATLQFPIITSRAIDIDTAQSVSKALERQYATFVQIVISLNPYLDLQQDKDMKGYLRKIHQNNPSLIELEESCMNVYSDEAIGASILFSLNEGSNGMIMTSNKNQLFSVEECLNNMTVNNLFKPEALTLPVAEAAMEHYCRKNNILLEAPISNADIDAASDQLALNKLKFKHQRNAEDATDRRNREFDNERRRDNASRMEMEREKMNQQADFQNRRDEIERLKMRQQRDMQDRKEEIDRVKMHQDLRRMEIEYQSKTQVKLSDNDVKKSNELVPTTLSVSLHVKDGQSFGGISNFVIGVKGLLHPVQSNEMVSNLLSGFKSGSKFFNFLRWTTGEISFLKDLILNVDGIKEDVVRKYNGGSHWWSTLKRRKSLAKMRNLTSRNKLLPNASIVCSMEEIVELKETYGLDLMDPKKIKKLMDQFFLLGFVIVDSSQELCYFIFDGETNYQAISFNGLEKENNSKNDFKEIYKMINSGRL